jgi:hypothetical protein
MRHFTNRRWIFQEHNAPCHISLRSTQWKQGNNINTLPWPPQSPDINIIENVWTVLKLRVQRRTNEIRNAGDLERVVRDIWSDLAPFTLYSEPLQQSTKENSLCVPHPRSHYKVLIPSGMWMFRYWYKIVTLNIPGVVAIDVTVAILRTHLCHTTVCSN